MAEENGLPAKTLRGLGALAATRSGKPPRRLDWPKRNASDQAPLTAEDLAGIEDWGLPEAEHDPSARTAGVKTWRCIAANQRMTPFARRAAGHIYGGIHSSDSRSRSARARKAPGARVALTWAGRWIFRLATRLAVADRHARGSATRNLRRPPERRHHPVGRSRLDKGDRQPAPSLRRERS